MDVSILHDDGAGGNRKQQLTVTEFCPCINISVCESETTMVKRANEPEIYHCRKWAKEPPAVLTAAEGEIGYIEPPAGLVAPSAPDTGPEPITVPADAPVPPGGSPVEEYIEPTSAAGETAPRIDMSAEG